MGDKTVEDAVWDHRQKVLDAERQRNRRLREITAQDPPDEIWVLRWGALCEYNPNKIITAEEGGWLMFASREHANLVLDLWKWDARPDRLYPPPQPEEDSE